MNFSIGDKVRVPKYYGDEVGIIVGVSLHRQNRYLMTTEDIDKCFNEFVLTDYDVWIKDKDIGFWAKDTFSENFLEAV